MKKHAVASVCALAQLVFQCQFPASAQVADTSTHTAPSAGGAGTMSLNLASRHAGVSAADVGVAHSLVIMVGGAKVNVSAGSMLTPAEMAAVYQVTNVGRQSLGLGTQGNAVAGTLSIGTELGKSWGNLVIPQNVKVVDTVSSLNVAGNLTNAGKLVFTGSGNNASAVLNANDIYNSGVIKADHGDLTVIASSITNAGGGLLQAANNLNLMSADITNHGTVSALAGNLNIGTATSANIMIDNNHGMLQAPQGDINVRGASYSGVNNVAISGGNLVSQNVNIYSGCGTANVNVGEVNGLVNIHAGAAHVVAATNNLQLGTMDITGDPSFYNTAGAVTINGALVFNGQPVAIVAKTNITSNAAGAIDTSSSTGSAGAITLVAGAAFTASPASSTGSGTTNGLNGGAGDSTTTLKIAGGTPAGGFIDLTGGSGQGGGSNPITLNSTSTSGTAGAQDGGNVLIVAYGGTGSNAGTINLPTTANAIQTGGSGAGKNGNVSMVAGSTTSGATSINIGGINTVGGTGSGGIVSLNTAKPVFTGGSSVSIKDGALLGAGTFAPGASTPTNITLNADINANQIKVNAGGNISWFNAGALSNTLTGFDGPFTIAFSPTQDIAYVTNFGSNNFGGSGYNPATDAGHTVTVINTKTGSIINTINVGTMPSGVAFNPTGTLAYVTNYNDPVTTQPGQNPGPGSVSVIDTKTSSVVGLIPVGNGAAAIALTPNGSTAYVVNYISNNVNVIDTATNSVIKTINVGANPGAIAINPAGTFAYVANSNSGTVSVIDLKTNTVKATIGGFNEPYTLSLDPSGNNLFVTNSGSNGPGAGTVSVVNTATNKIATTVSGAVGSAINNPAGSAINPNGTEGYITNYVNTAGTAGGNTVSILNTATKSMVGNIDLSPATYINSVSFNPSGTLAYTANYNNVGNNYTPGSGSVSIISLTPPVMRANSVSLAAGTAGSGSISAFTQTGTLTANAIGGNVSVNNIGSVSLSPDGKLTNGATHTFHISTAPDANGNGQINIADKIIMKAADGFVNLESTETGSGAGGIQQTSTGFISTPALRLVDTGAPSITAQSIGMINKNIFTNAKTLIAQTPQDVFVSDSSAVSIIGEFSGRQYSIRDSAPGGILLKSPISGTEVDLATTATSGTTISQAPNAPITASTLLDIGLGGTSTANLVSAPNSVAALLGSGNKTNILLGNAGNSIVLDTFAPAQNVTVLNADVVTNSNLAPLAAGSLAVSANSITLSQIFVPVVSAVITGSGTATITDKTNVVDVRNSSAPLGTLNVTSTMGSLTVDGTVSAQKLNLQSNVGGVTVKGTAGGDNNNTSVTAFGPIETTGKGVIAGLSVSLTTNTFGKGEINATTNATYNISASTFSGAANNVTLNNISAVNLSSSTAGGSFTLKSGGGITQFGNIVAGTSLSLVAPAIQIGGSSSGQALTANNGNLLLQSTDTTAGSIQIQNSATMSASGDVIISVGSASPPKVASAPPPNVTQSTTAGGKIFYGKNNIYTEAPNNTFTATGKNIIFSTGNLSASAIQILGGVGITAFAPTANEESVAGDDDGVVIDTAEDE